MRVGEKNWKLKPLGGRIQRKEEKSQKRNSAPSDSNPETLNFQEAFWAWSTQIDNHDCQPLCQPALSTWKVKLETIVYIYMDNWVFSPLPTPFNLLSYFMPTTPMIYAENILLNSRVVDRVQKLVYSKHWRILLGRASKHAEREFEDGIAGFSFHINYNNTWRVTVPPGDICSKVHSVKGKQTSCGQEGNSISTRWYLNSIKQHNRIGRSDSARGSCAMFL